jgi:fructokinase
MFKACLGGSVCNFAQALARQGIGTSYLNPLSKDKFGDRFASLLLDSGVQLPAATRSALPTALAIVSLDEKGAATYSFHRGAVADRDINAAHLLARLPANPGLLHTGGLALVPTDIEKTIEVLRTAAAREILISIDANVRPLAVEQSEPYFEGVYRALALASIIKVSDEDLVHLGLEDPTLEDAAHRLFDASTAELIALTRGAEGATLITRSAMVSLPAPEGLAIVDTVGAGDCFHAGLIAFLERTGNLTSRAGLRQLEPGLLRDALGHAIAASSINVTRAGCVPATWEETRRFADRLAFRHSL